MKVIGTPICDLGYVAYFGGGDFLGCGALPGFGFAGASGTGGPSGGTIGTGSNGDGSSAPPPPTHKQFCSNLKAQQPYGCNANSYPPAPGFPSSAGATYAGNGCGSSMWSTVSATLFLDSTDIYFSGDLNRPVKDHPGVDFTAACDGHDACYSGDHVKNMCDHGFQYALQNICNASSAVFLCNQLKGDYFKAVSKYGQSAYDDDQADFQCSQWGNAMKKNGCTTP